jgi:methionyl aminopeptidase
MSASNDKRLANSSEEARTPPKIEYKRPRDIDRIREAGVIVSLVLAEVAKRAKPGVSTLALDELAFGIVSDCGGTPSFLGHKSGEHIYRHTLCLSLNDEIVHAIPRADRILRDGDLLSIDVGVKVRGYHADSAITVGVGEVSGQVEKLISVTRESLWEGIRAIRPRARIQTIGKAVQRCVEREGFTVVRELTGHGVGRQLWEAPEVLNFVDKQRPDPLMHDGLVIAIEPMVNAGQPDIVHDDDGWTIRTKDRSLSAHFEHTVAIGKHGYEVLTIGPHDPGPPWLRQAQGRSQPGT